MNVGEQTGRVLLANLDDAVLGVAMVILPGQILNIIVPSGAVCCQHQRQTITTTTSSNVSVVSTYFFSLSTVSCPYSHSFIATCLSLASYPLPFVTVSFCSSHCSPSRQPVPRTSSSPGSLPPQHVIQPRTKRLPTGSVHSSSLLPTRER